MHPLFMCSIYLCNCLLETDSGIICSCVSCTMSTYTYASNKSSCSSLDRSLSISWIMLNSYHWIYNSSCWQLSCSSYQQNTQPSSLVTPLVHKQVGIISVTVCHLLFQHVALKTLETWCSPQAFHCQLSSALTACSLHTFIKQHLSSGIQHSHSPVPKPPTESSSAARDYYLRANFSSCEPRKPSLWSYGWSVSSCAAHKMC